MLQSLNLKSFGKFYNKSFSLSSLNLFLGKNESGKSTIFDALLWAISKPRGNHSEGKRLQARYGNEKKVEIQGDILKTVDIDEFLNLHCLKSNEIRIDFSRSQWLDSLRKQLFSGGIDPGAIADELEKDSQNSGNTARAKQMNSLKKEINDLETSVKQLLNEKKSLLAEEERIRAMQSRKEELAHQVNELEAQIRNVEEKKKQEDKVREKKKLHSLYQSLIRRQDLRNRFNKLEIYSDSVYEKLAAIEKQKIALIEHEKNIKWNRELYHKRILEAEESLRKREELFQAEFNRENLARNLREKLEENIQNPFTKEMKVRDNRLFFGGIVSLILGILCLIFGFPEKIVFFISGVCFLLGSFVLLYLSSGIKIVPDEERNAEALRRYKREWLELGFHEDLSIYSTFQSLRDYFFHYIAKRLQDAEKIQESKNQLSILQKEKSEMDLEWEKVRSDLQTLEAQEREILASLGAGTREEVNARFREKIEVMGMLRNLESQIQTESPESDWEFLRIETERKLAEMDKEAIQNTPMEEIEYLQLQQELRKLNEEWKKKNDELRKIEIQNVESRTSVEERLKMISPQLFHKEIELLKKQEEEQSAIQNLKATQKCCEIFRFLHQESKDIFASLSQEIENSMEKFFPKRRKIQIQNLTGDITVEDAGGALRSIDKLSQGTRDCFYIAAKLALCEKSHPWLKLFLMDEPFASLDEERTKLLIHMIHHYTKEKGWQIFIFSKDLGLKEWFQDEESVKVYELELQDIQ